MTQICIIAGNYDEAKTWANGQLLEDSDWFYPTDESDLKSRNNFHVIVVGTAGYNVPAAYFDKIYNLATERGRLGR